MNKAQPNSNRRLVLVLGDQLWLNNPALLAADKAQDTVLMVEALEESQHVWSHQARSAMFLSAMRHFSEELKLAGFRLSYLRIGDHKYSSLRQAWKAQIEEIKPDKIVACEAGDYRVEQTLIELCTEVKIPLELLPDSHFMCSRQDFAAWAGPSTTQRNVKTKQLRMEMFYRIMRKRHQVLIQSENAEEPEGGQWNFDADNRQSFSKSGPGKIPNTQTDRPDDLTQEVFKDVGRRLAKHPGTLKHFAWPVNRQQALAALDRFVEQKLEYFGPYEDAMWTGQPYLYHSLLSAALNLHLLDPREVIAAAENSYRQGRASLSSAEGFIRQILGWREFMRGVYWLDMPRLRQDNHYQASTALPTWYWTGKTQMNCMREVITQTLEYGYAHHIQRLMIVGNFALIAGLVPQQVEDWYLAVYVDAVDWVELPNVAGMTLYANGGRFTTKPYAASGAYVKRMSNYCQGCRYSPEVKTGPKACPMSTFYWDFLMRHEAELVTNQRAALMMRNLARYRPEEREAIRTQAQAMLENIEQL